MKCVINFPITSGLMFLWFQKEIKIYHKKNTVTNFIFVFLSDANRQPKSLVLIPPPLSAFYFLSFLMFNAEKCLMSLESKKAEHWIQQDETSQVFGASGRPAALELVHQILPGFNFRLWFSFFLFFPNNFFLSETPFSYQNRTCSRHHFYPSNIILRRPSTCRVCAA